MSNFKKVLAVSALAALAGGGIALASEAYDTALVVFVLALLGISALAIVTVASAKID